jgi:folate-binding protein YgfZ
VVTTAIRVARRRRDFVRVDGPEAASYLERMVSNEVETLDLGDACEALLLTAKGRLIAPLVVWRRGPEDFLLLTEPGQGESVIRTLRRSRFATKAEIEPEEHESLLVLGGRDGIPNRDYGVEVVEVLDRPPLEGAAAVGEDELELLRIRARTPRVGRELDDRVLPAEAGLDERAISFTKGCYPGQEPVARLHYRGRANRGLRVLELECEELPEYDAELELEGKVVGRITSAARDGDHVVALGYVRREVPPGAELRCGERLARQL